jgi:cytoskeletal protein CcmA (bactofilin family)
MFTFKNALAVIAVFGLSTASLADTFSTRNGGDTFFAGAQISQAVDAVGDTFMAARSVKVSGTTQGDLHVSGLDVSVNVDALEDLYVMGGSVVIRGAVAEDLTAAGFSLRTESSSHTQGNVRLMGNSVTIEGPIEGALSVMGRDVIVNAAIKGDARILAQTLSFGPDAVVSGTLTYSTEEKMAVPDRVAAAERVVFEKVSGGRVWEEWQDVGKDMPALPTFASIMFGFVISLLFFLVLGALMLGFMPKRLSKMRRSIATAPGQTLLLGVIGLSVLFGMVPIVALTIAGLPFVPVVLLAIVVLWTLGYALGAYSVAMRLWSGLGGHSEPGTIIRLSVFAAAIIFVALLNFIPFVGWMANYTLVLLGIGAMTRAVFQSLLGNPGVALDVDLKPIHD